MPHTLLLADDSVTIQRVIELTFADEDIRVVAVSDGEQAIETLERSRPDIVLADVGMPGRDGYEVAEYIKRTPRLAQVPVLLLTGAFEPIDRSRAERVGCNGVLAKPFEPQLVIARVKELLQNPGANLLEFKRPAADEQAAPLRADGRAAAAPHTPPAHEPAVSEPEVDHYFEQLDRAFASLANAAKDREGAPRAETPGAEQPDWFSTVAGPVPVPTPAAPADSSDAPPQEPDSASTSHTQPVDRFSSGPPEPQFHPPATPPLADAFAALLAAERSLPPPAPSPPMANSAAESQQPPPSLSEDMIEDIVRRVVDRLSDRTVRDLAFDVVTRTAERLVREEIDRIKNT